MIANVEDVFRQGMEPSVKNARVCLADHSNQTTSGIDLLAQSIVKN